MTQESVLNAIKKRISANLAGALPELKDIPPVKLAGIWNKANITNAQNLNGSNTSGTVRSKKREEAREFVEAYKATHPCVDCGKTDSRFLTFDHVRGTKKMNVSQMVNQGYSKEAIQAEIAKCEVRCLECHHLRHH